MTVTAEQMTLEDLGDSKVRVTIVQAEGGPAAEAITASAKQPTFLESVATELSVPKVYYDTAPATISVTVAPPPPPPPVPLSQAAEVNLVSDGRNRPWIVGDSESLSPSPSSSWRSCSSPSVSPGGTPRQRRGAATMRRVPAEPER